MLNYDLSKARKTFCEKYKVQDLWPHLYNADTLPVECNYAIAATMSRGARFVERVLPCVLADKMEWDDMSDKLFGDIHNRVPFPSADENLFHANNNLLTEALENCVTDGDDGQRVARITELRADADALMRLFTMHTAPRWELTATYQQRQAATTCPASVRPRLERFFDAYPKCDVVAGDWSDAPRLLEKVPFIWQAYGAMAGRRTPLLEHAIKEDPLRLTGPNMCFSVPLTRTGPGTYATPAPGEIAHLLYHTLYWDPYMTRFPTFGAFTWDGAIKFWTDAMHTCTPDEIVITDDAGALHITVSHAFFARVTADAGPVFEALSTYVLRAQQ